MASSTSTINIALRMAAYASGTGNITYLAASLMGLANSASKLTGTGALSGLAANFGAIEGAAAAAALESAGFDYALQQIISDSAHLQYTTAQMDLALHGTADQIAQLNPAIIQWADNSLYTTAQVHQLVTALSEHGLDVTAILHGDGQAAIQLGEAIGGDPVDAANLLASTLQIFRAQGLKASDAANILTGAFYNGIPSASELQSAIDSVGGAAAVMGVKFSDLATVLDILAQAGLSGSEAGTSLRYVLQAISDPTTKAATDMNALGLTVVNTTSPAFEKLKAQLDASGKAGQDAVANFDGTSVGLNNMFKEAQKLKLIPLNETFNEWAVSSGAMSNKFYDAKGNFIGLGNAIDLLLTQLQAKSGGNKELMMQYIEEMFNVRSGRAAMILSSLENFKNQYNATLDQLGNTSAAQDAQKLLNTLPGAWQQLQTTFTSFLSSSGNQFLAPLTNILHMLNNLVNYLMSVNPQVAKFVGMFILFGAVIAPIMVVLGAVVALVLFFGSALAAPLAAFGIALVAIPLLAGALAGLGVWLSSVGNLLGRLFGSIGPALQPVMQALGDLQPQWDALMAQLKPLTPVIEMVAAAIGTQLLSALGILIGVLAGVLAGIAAFVTGVIQFFTGFTEQWRGIFQFFRDLFTGNWNQLGNDWYLIVQGTITLVEGLFHATLGAIVATVWGFVSTVIGYFQTLYDVLVGHSIIPDLANAIILVFMNLASEMGTWGQNMLLMMGQGILSAAQFVTNPVLSVASWIAAHLGFHSPPAAGPLSDSNTWMPNMMQMMGSGVTANQGALLGPIDSLTNTMASRFTYFQGTGVKTFKDMFAQIIATEKANEGPTATQFYTMGQDVVVGMINGMNSKLGALRQVAFQLGDTVTVATGNRLRISSPSRVFEYFGNMVVQGFVGGIAAGKDLVQGTANDTFGLSGSAFVTAGSRLALSSPGLTAGAAGAGGTSVANFYIDGKAMYQVVMDRLSGEMKMNNLGTQWR